VIWVIGVACWSSALSSVFQLALYRYATDGTPPAAFSGIDFAGAFRTKQSGVRRLFGS